MLTSDLLQGIICFSSLSIWIFSKKEIAEIINIQPVGNMAKNYQVKQIRNIILKYSLHLKTNEK